MTHEDPGRQSGFDELQVSAVRHGRRAAACRGGIERIGSAGKPFVRCEIGGARQELTASVPDHAVAVRMCLEQLTDPADGCLQEAVEVAAIGFKAVHGGRSAACSG